MAKTDDESSSDEATTLFDDAFYAADNPRFVGFWQEYLENNADAIGSLRNIISIVKFT